MPALTKLIHRLGATFKDQRLLQSALIHRSFAHERPDQVVGLLDSERLEFLGDAIVNLVAAAMVFERFPAYGEGDLTIFRSALIRTGTLAGFARELGLGGYIRLSKGEDASGARNRDALLADMFESLVAAIYLDQGLDAARMFLTPLFDRQIERIAAHGLELDYKSRLQERIQAQMNSTPRYRTVAVTGPDHQRDITVEVLINGASMGVGQGPSKQAAAQAAAQAALERLAAEHAES